MAISTNWNRSYQKLNYHQFVQFNSILARLVSPIFAYDGELAYSPKCIETIFLSLWYNFPIPIGMASTQSTFWPIFLSQFGPIASNRSISQFAVEICLYEWSITVFWYENMADKLYNIGRILWYLLMRAYHLGHITWIYVVRSCLELLNQLLLISWVSLFGHISNYNCFNFRKPISIFQKHYQKWKIWGLKWEKCA